MTTKYQHYLRRDMSRPQKVMIRMERRFREHGVRSYRGWTTWGRYFAKLNFDHGFIIVGPFGDLTWRAN